jgi:hypothetical protein
MHTAVLNVIADFSGDAHVLERIIGGMVIADCLRRMSSGERQGFFKRSSDEQKKSAA